MGELFFRHALLPGGWQRNVRIAHDAAGCITHVTPDTLAPEHDFDGDVALPGMANLHSHAFQRAMAGLAEWRGGKSEDNFWSWREVMYRFALRLRPQDLRAIAALAYMEMLESGFTAVGEFHYLHHQPDGAPYHALAEMAMQVIDAADTTGIGLTLLPVLYAQGGFGGIALQPQQLRFGNDTDRFLKLVDGCRDACKTTPRTIVGIAPHSLRAVSPEALDAVVIACSKSPIHIHIAEQEKEVADCLAFSGARPVQWLLDHQPINARWCLVHATHMEHSESSALAKSGAVAGLCPLTEANLGDGIFDGVAYHEAGGRWGIGSDSHIRIDLAEELRLLEYSQRLRDRQRNRLARPGEANGHTLFTTALSGGAQALGQPMGKLAAGQWCDIVSLDHNHPALIGRQDDDWLNSWVFAGDRSCVRDVWAAGRQVVKDGRHTQHDVIVRNFATTMAYLTDS